MEELFQKKEPYEKYKEILAEPLKADKKVFREDCCHYYDCYRIDKNGIKHLDIVVMLKDKITNLFFLYTDFGENRWDENYWFFVGERIEGSNTFYLAYESDCCGTGFGLGSTAKLYVSRDKELLYDYGLTDKQRALIANNIDVRFKCDSLDLLYATLHGPIEL